MNLALSFYFTIFPAQTSFVGRDTFAAPFAGSFGIRFIRFQNMPIWMSLNNGELKSSYSFLEKRDRIRIKTMIDREIFPLNHSLKDGS